ncbi:sialate O-acetylesterase [Chthonomonas calidirosea]|uniref:sialate O-acetylesterase n=1 Tax=Chthonomonas calidirosea TaxID=454171 RepID=UPI0006EC8090|nr:sialate O-acetylesterase [Chthonomonas calidirosea]CEK13062.1 Domain of unknown function (DUF303) [Chthonomonas calidirosea]
MKATLSLLVVLLLCFALRPVSAQSNAGNADLPLVSRIFSSNMVLQRERRDPIWGWTTPNANVTVSVTGPYFQEHLVVTADDKGAWQTRIGPLPVGGPYQITVTGPDNQKEQFDNVLSGDVWLCSGQSNMQFGIANGLNAQQEIANANYPQIRLFSAQLYSVPTPMACLNPPQPNLVNQWVECNPQNVATGGWGGFSAVAYFFGRALYQALGVPIGLIHSSWGGTPAEAWISARSISQIADLQDALRKVENDPNAKPNSFGIMPSAPTVLYNGMIAPLVPYAIRGVIWYQGESNVGRAYQYRTLLAALIRDWRSAWNEGNFPFLIVQLPNFGPQKPDPTESAWAELRESQYIVASTVPNTGIVCTIDIGDANDIHPKDKQDVGKRLALYALAKVYGQKVTYSGPTFRSMKVEGHTVRIFFDHTDGGLVAKGGKLTGFAIAGSDKQWHWADAQIDGNSVVLSSPDVPNPVAVRYAWADNPECNLYNGAGLPAFPFRTDDWTEITRNNH